MRATNRQVVRRSGPRIPGGVYWECAAEHLVVYASPYPVDVAALRLPTLGFQLWEHAGVVDVLDWVGGAPYPTPESFLAEAEAYGLSRRFSNPYRVGRLSTRSCLYIVHGGCMLGPNEPRGPGFILRAPLDTLAVIASQMTYDTITRKTRLPVRLAAS
jgi:hypothetical protein